MAKISITSYEEADKKLLELLQLQSFIAKKEADMNSRIQTVKEKYDVETADARAQTQLIETDIQVFCSMNKTDFLKQRARKLTHGVIGFRTNPPKVIQLNKKFTIRTSLELLKKIYDDKYVRMKEEINKDAILSDYSSRAIDDSNLAGVGLRIDQEETFFVEVDWQNIPQIKDAV